MAIKISIAGLGWWGKVMIERLSRSNKLEIVNLIDPFPDQEALKLAKANNLEIYKDLDDALSSKTFEAIALCTPNSFHMEQTLKVSKLGIHVFCEKPPGRCLEDILKMMLHFVFCCGRDCEFH